MSVGWFSMLRSSRERSVTPWIAAGCRFARAVSAAFLVAGLAACSRAPARVGTAAASSASSASGVSVATAPVTPDGQVLVPSLDGPNAPLSGPSAVESDVAGAQQHMSFCLRQPLSLGPPARVKYDPSLTPSVAMFWPNATIGPVLITESLAKDFKGEGDLRAFVASHSGPNIVSKLTVETLPVTGVPAMIIDGDGPKAALILVGGEEINVLIPHGRTIADLRALAVEVSSS